MHIALLGFLDTLMNILTKVFNGLVSVLMTIIQYLFNLIIDLLVPIFASFFLRIQGVILRMLDTLAEIFDVLSGAVPVQYKEAGALEYNKESNILDAFMAYGPVSEAFLKISLFSAGLATLFTIYAVVKSMSDMALDDKSPVGEILRRGLKAGLTFLMVPLLVIVMLQIANLVVVQVSAMLDKAMGAEGKTTLGAMVFLSGTVKAVRDDPNGANFSFTSVNPGDIRTEYFYGKRRYDDIGQVEEDFDVRKYDFLPSIISAVALTFILLGGLLVFVRRIFEVLLLYVTAPIFVAAIPLDDGAMFSKWRDLFIAKMFAGFGTVFAMKIFMIFMPILFGGEIKFSDAASVDAILKIVIMIGGAWSAYKSQQTFLQILNPEAAGADQEASAFGIAMAGAAAGKLASALTPSKKSKSNDKKNKGNDEGEDGEDGEGGDAEGGVDGGGGGGGGAAAGAGEGVTQAFAG